MYRSGLFVWGGMALMVALVAFFVIWDRACDTANPREVEGTVTGKYVKRYSKADVFMVELETDRGVEVVQVRDSVWAWDWRSADVFAGLKEGKKVTLKVAGYRSGWLSLFPRINEVK